VATAQLTMGWVDPEIVISSNSLPIVNRIGGIAKLSINNANTVISNDLVLNGGLTIPVGQLTIGTVPVTATAAKLNILTNVTASAFNLNLLTGLGALPSGGNGSAILTQIVDNATTDYTVPLTTTVLYYSQTTNRNVLLPVNGGSALLGHEIRIIVDVHAGGFPTFGGGAIQFRSVLKPTGFTYFTPTRFMNFTATLMGVVAWEPTPETSQIYMLAGDPLFDGAITDVGVHGAGNLTDPQSRFVLKSGGGTITLRPQAAGVASRQITIRAMDANVTVQGDSTTGFETGLNNGVGSYGGSQTVVNGGACTFLYSAPDQWYTISSFIPT